MAKDLKQDGIVIIPGKRYCLTWEDALTSGAYEIYQGTTKIGQVGGHYHTLIEEDIITVFESVTLAIS